MLDSNALLQLYANVLIQEIARSGIREQDIKRGVQNIAHVYAPNPTSLKSDTVNVANYNDVGHRCAYLHKFGAFHTAMVQDMMVKILDQQFELFEELTSSGDFKICSLGGGPGSDVIGAISALSGYFNAFETHVTIVDIMEQWKFTFKAVIAELARGNYGILRTSTADNFLHWDYIRANLLDTMPTSVNKAIGQASLITMVKFVSAASCQETEEMVRKIFRSMKPGALLLFIDNAAGGFHGLIKRVANEYRFITTFGPLYHNTYVNEALKTERFGYTSCFTTTVTVHLLCKPLQGTKMPYNIPVTPHDQYSNISNGVTLGVGSASQNLNTANVHIHQPRNNRAEGRNRSPRRQGNARNQYSYAHLPPEGSQAESEEEPDPCDNCCVIS